MNDPPAPVLNENNPQPEVNNANNNNNNDNQPRPRRNIFNFGPVKLQWEDFLSSVDELSHVNRLPSTGQPLDILSLGCSTISKGRDQPGRIVTIDVEMTNLQPKIEGKIRLVEKILRICGTFLRQDPEGVAGQVFDICANVIIEIYQSNSDLIQTLQPFYWREMLSTIKYSVDENKELGAGMRLGLCNIIADLEETEHSSKTKLQEDNMLTQYLREVTNNEREQVELMQKIALLLPSDEVSAADSALMEALREQPQHRSYTVDELAKLFEAMFSEVSVGLLDSTLDVLMAMSRRVTCALDILELGSCIKNSILAGLGEESDRVIVLAKLMELLRVLIFCNMSTERITEVFTQLVPASIKALESIKNTSDFSQKTICKMIELYCLAAERDLDLTDVSREILPNIINTSSRVNDKDAVLKELFNYASYALCSKDPVSFLKSGLDSVFHFVRTGLGVEFVNDSEVVCTCLELASLFIRQKAEPQGLLSFFEIQMTSSFEVPAKWDCEDQSFKRLTLLDVLKQGLIVIQNGINRYKYFIFYMPPIYTMIEQFLRKAGNPAEKNNVHKRRMELLREVVQILIEEVKKGNDISILLSDALPMVFELYGSNKHLEATVDQQEELTAEQQPVEIGTEVPTAAPAKRSLRAAQRVPVEGEAKNISNRDATHEIINRLRFVIVKYESNNDYALLLLLRSCHDFALRNFHFFNPRKIGEVFRNLLDKGQRDHLKGFIRICNSELNDEKYQSIRNYIFGDVGLSSRNFEELCKVLAMIFDLRKFQNEAVNKIIVRIVASLEEFLVNNSFTVEMAKDLTERINRLILFKNLFGDELEKNKEKTAEELNDIFQSKFPQDMVQDEFMMNLLTSLSLRIERISFALPKWKHVADFTVDLLNKFFAIELPDDPSLATNETKIKYRREMLDKMVYELPKSVEMRKYLASLGYSESLWEKDVWLDVEVDDRKNIEENFKASLIGIYGEYVDIYKTLYPNAEKINIDGRDFELDRVFADDRENTTIDDLKSRRNVFLKAIDKRIKNHPRKAFIVNRKLSLLTREDQIEADVEQQKLQEKLEPAQKRRYWCRFNNTFVNSANCCGKSIVGCYAPDGDHAEKPIENSLKANLGFISVYDNEGASPMSHEIENAEVLFTDQGLFIYKIYTNGHSYDTSLVWTSMFKALVESGLVPAIIIPRGFPNNRTFGLFESMIPTELVGGIITYKDDFFEEAGVESYFDFKAAKIQPGDVILTEKNVNHLKLPDLSVAKEKHKGKTLLRRSTGTLAVNKDNKTKPKSYNAIRKDLAGVVMTRVILKLKADSNSQLSDNVEAFARFLSQYITLYIEFGIRDFEILTVGFDLDQFVKRKGKKKGKKPMTKEEKESLITRILQIIHGEIEALFESQAKLKSLFARNKEQFFELQQHLLQVVKNLHRELATVKSEIQHTRLAQQRQRNVMQQGANNEAQQLGEGQQTGPEIKADNKETAQITMTEQEIKREQEKAHKVLNEIKAVLKKSTVTVRIGDLRPQMQIFAMKWIFGNEDRVWRDRGGRPGEETLQSFINFVTVSKSGQEPAQPSPLNNVTNPATPSNVTPGTAPPDTQTTPTTEDEEEDEPKDEFSRSEMRLDHYGNEPFGGFVEFTRKSLPPTDDKAKDDVDNESLAHFGFSGLNVYELDTLEKVDMVGYCIGDYIEKDNFEVVTAWVHPAYRSIGVAWKLYEITIDEIHRRGGKYMTYDILQGSLERVIRSSPVLSVCRMLGITDLCVAKRRKSYANQTSMGTEEQFERIRANVKWILMGKKALNAKHKADQLVQKLKFWKLKHVPHEDKFEGILSVL